ncbi:DegV family protein [Caproiciproducens sp. MSJ-32]|uniref:DegV family protein n=1 Tax=Caproiciproducens sp. MSJ-32 TaxID=2841527 RepID=UPI001C100656|nr:DegV family protein [Caproiciproducens sp. MSJ-32]
MMNTVIMTDSCCDLPLNFVKENNIDVISLGINIDSKYYSDDLGQSIDIKEFYNKLRTGIMPTTSQANAFSYEEKFKKYVEEGNAVIYIGFSSALSGSVNSARIAMENIKDEYKEADITIIDSKSASLGLGLLVYKAAEMLKNGASKDEIVSWVEDNKLKLNHWFTVDDLNHLKRGGRVSGTVAAVGTLLGIKPVLHVDNEGRLVPVSKVKGRKKSIKVLQDTIKERIVNPEEQVIFISHGDCLEEAEYLKKLILDDVKVKDIIINNVGPTIGTHSGPGTIALFFIGKER